MIEFFSGIVSVLMWLVFGLPSFFLGFYYSQPVILEPGIVYSYKQAEEFGFEPNQLYLEILDDLKPKYLRVIAYWDRIEKQKDEYDFSELDFQIQETERRQAKITLILGEKVPRWPECHYPDWAAGLSRQNQQEQILELISLIGARYKDSSALEFWQVENEPFLAYGKCPAYDKDFYKKELAAIKSISSKPIVVTSSGELDSWLRSFIYGDIVGFSVYRRFFVSLPFTRIGLDYPLPPLFYQTKAKAFNLFFKKDIMVTEFQLEPWLDKPIVETSSEDQFAELDFNRFVDYLEYARKTRIKRIYFWGIEWWYWLKQNSQPEFLDYVKENIFVD
ncbi:MAG: hypothetical protein AB1721_02740 [Patescibacteria group bacterium]